MVYRLNCINNKASLFFFSGFNFKTLSDFSNHSENNEHFLQHFSLMANALNIQDIRDISTLSAEINAKYDVRILNNYKFKTYNY